MSPDSNRIDLKYDLYLFKWTLNSTSWDSRFHNISFSICSRVQNVLYVKSSSLFSFFNVLKKKCRLSLPFVLFINSVANRCISNTLSTFNCQYFLLREFLRLHYFLFAPLKKVQMYNINEKNSNIKITRRTFPENLNGKL